jgi:glycosyltransferase A (GT-A) superfamily protein (DUF2064 family)
MTQILIIFAREPIPGRTKTRLCPPLDGSTAAALYACFLSDTLGLLHAVPDVRPVIAHTPESRPAYFAELAPGIAACSQRGADLGERLADVFEEVAGGRLLPVGETGRQGDKEQDREPVSLSPCLPVPVSNGPSSVVIIGSDSPDLPAAYLCEAFARLAAGADVALGPSDDGGYYLIGLRAPQPRLLREVPMSTPTVLADTLALADELGLRVELLPPWYDVDTAAELARLAASLRAAPPDVAPQTRAFLATQLPALL